MDRGRAVVDVVGINVSVTADSVDTTRIGRHVALVCEYVAREVSSTSVVVHVPIDEQAGVVLHQFATCVQFQIAEDELAGIRRDQAPRKRVASLGDIIGVDEG